MGLPRVNFERFMGSPAVIKLRSLINWTAQGGLCLVGAGADELKPVSFSSRQWSIV